MPTHQRDHHDGGSAQLHTLLKIKRIFERLALGNLTLRLLDPPYLKRFRRPNDRGALWRHGRFFVALASTTESRVGQIRLNKI